MSTAITASKDPQLSARVTGHLEMLYAEGPSEADDRPPYVLAASGLSEYREYLAVVQDDANWLALIGPDDKVLSVPLPAGPDGKRVFTKSRGNADQKLDFEACICVPADDGKLELVAFSSGSSEGREWILRVCEVGEGSPPQLDAQFLRADSFFAMLRGTHEFCGAGLNIEGAVTIDDERIILFQRGNAEPSNGRQPCDATAEVRWSELRRYLADPEKAEPPSLRSIRTYDLGQLGGVRLTFSDAEHLGEGRILYSASAEDSAGGDGEVKGSVLGLLEADGQANWAELIDENGKPFRGKIEGLTLDPQDPRKVHFVIDDDDDTVPSKIYRAELGEAFFAER